MTPSHVHGRYALYEALGRGGAASVYLGVARGDALAPLAIKVLHDSASREAGAITRLLDEVRLSRLIANPHVVPVLDFVSDGEEMLAVMEYVHGEPLSRLLADARRLQQPVPIDVAAAILSDVLRGLHTAHEASGTDGKPLELVHRDATPENMLVGADGIARITDFGVAKAEGRLQATRDGGLRGKIAYCAPEQIGGEVSRRTDIYAAGLVLWEVLVSERPIQGDNEAAILTKALDPQIPAPSTRRADVPARLDAVVMRALSLDPEARFGSALEMLLALETAAGGVATASKVGAWVEAMAGDRLAQRATSITGMLEAERPFARVDAPRDVSLDARPAAALPSHAKQRLPLAFGLVVMLLAGALVVLVWYARTRPPVEPVTAALDSAPAPQASVAPVVPAAASVLVVASASATASAASSTLVASTASAPLAASPASTPRPRTGARPPPAKCDPPWLIDSRGIRRYNPDCVK